MLMLIFWVVKQSKLVSRQIPTFRRSVLSRSSKMFVSTCKFTAQKSNIDMFTAVSTLNPTVILRALYRCNHSHNLELHKVVSLRSRGQECQRPDIHPIPSHLRDLSLFVWLLNAQLLIKIDTTQLWRAWKPNLINFGRG